MIRPVKKALPAVVFIVLSTAALVLQLDASREAILMGGLATASAISLLLYAVIRWDEQHAEQQVEMRQLAGVVGQATDAILIGDRCGRILYANAAARQAYDLAAAPDAHATSTFAVLGVAALELQGLIDGALQGRSWRGELAHTDCAGAARSAVVNMFRLEAFQGHTPAVAVIAHDLTERKALHRQLLHSQKLAAVGELAAGLAHEINNPMAAIQSQVGLAKDVLLLECPPDPHHQQVLACVDEAARQVQRCSKIVDSLLRFARREQQELRAIDLDEAIDQALTFVGTMPKIKRLELIHEPAPKPVAARANLQSITQILVNLLINAADATAQQGTVRLRARPMDATRVAIDVQDNGSGIQPEILERVFEPFFTTKSSTQGTGLGLSISYGLAQSLGGDLQLQCAPEGGTTATLILPCAGDHAASITRPM